MNLQYTRKYERVNKNNNPKFILPKAKLQEGTSAATTADERTPKVEIEEETITDELSTKTYVQASNVDGEIILEEVQFDGNDSSYVDYAINMDTVNGNFSSTTIVNGTTISVSELQFGEAVPTDSVLVMPLDAIDVPIETMNTNENQIRTIHIGPRNLEAKAPANSAANYIVKKEKPVSTKQPNWLAARLPKPAKQVNTEPKMYYPDKHTTSLGGKRGLIRFGRSRMIADTHTTIAVSEFKNQLNDTSDIIGRLDLAPSTKAMMHFLNTKGVNKLFANPGRKMGAKIRRGFVRHLCIKQTEVEVTYSDMPLLPVGFTPPIDPRTIKRITRKRRYPEAEEYQRKMSNAKIFKAEEAEEVIDDPQYEEVIIPDCKDSIILLSNMESVNQTTMDDEGNIYSDEFNPSIAIEEEQELDSFPFEDTLEGNTEFSEGQEFDPGDEFTTEDEYQNQFHENKATIIMIEDENGTRENVEVHGINGDSETQVIFCESLDDGKEIMILPDEPMCESIIETVMTS